MQEEYYYVNINANRVHTCTGRVCDLSLPIVYRYHITHKGYTQERLTDDTRLQYYCTMGHYKGYWRTTHSNYTIMRKTHHNSIIINTQTRQSNTYTHTQRESISYISSITETVSKYKL